MSASTVTRPAEMSTAEFRRQFDSFAPGAWSRYDENRMSLKEWCRAEARQFHHEAAASARGAVPFLRTYYALATYANVRQGLEEQRAAAARDFEDEGETEEVFTPDGQQTAAEIQLARAELNRILFREHTRWWDAFQEEENGRAGWIWHAAKVLARASDVSREDAALVVEGWLESKKDQLA